MPLYSGPGSFAKKKKKPVKTQAPTWNQMQSEAAQMAASSAQALGPAPLTPASAPSVMSGTSQLALSPMPPKPGALRPGIQAPGIKPTAIAPGIKPPTLARPGPQLPPQDGSGPGPMYFGGGGGGLGGITPNIGIQTNIDPDILRMRNLPDLGRPSGGATIRRPGDGITPVGGWRGGPDIPDIHLPEPEEEPPPLGTAMEEIEPVPLTEEQIAAGQEAADKRDIAQRTEDAITKLLYGKERNTAAEEKLINEMLQSTVGQGQADLNARMARAGFGTSGALSAIGGDLRAKAAREAAGEVMGVRETARQELMDKLGLGLQAQLSEREQAMKEDAYDRYLKALEEMFGIEPPPPPSGGGGGGFADILPGVVGGEDPAIGLTRGWGEEHELANSDPSTDYDSMPIITEDQLPQYATLASHLQDEEPYMSGGYKVYSAPNANGTGYDYFRVLAQPGEGWGAPPATLAD